MQKHITKIYISFIVIGVLFCIYGGVFAKNEIYSHSDKQSVTQWEMEQSTEDNGSVYCYSKTLPTNNITGMTVAFYTVHMNVEVTIDNTLIYQLKPGKHNHYKTTGYQWNFVPLSSEYKGKNITIRMIPAYQDSTPREEFYYGLRSDVEKMLVNKDMFRLVQAFIILFLGIIMFAYSRFIIAKTEATNTLLHFSIFSILLGIFSICEISMSGFLIPWNIASVFADHFSLMIMPIPFIMFLREGYQNKDNKAWSYYCYFNCGVVLLRILLQITGIQELRETLWMTHISIAVFAIIVVIISIHEFCITKITRQLKLNTMCVLVIVFATLLELLMFKLFNKSNGYGTLGFLFYVVVMGIETMRKSHKILERAQESEVYKKLAYMDELTGVYNRTAFRRDMDNRFTNNKHNKKISPTVLFMFDLNDLKKCNDNYGHENGDKYITMVSETLLNVFDIDGRCYRIGGDEFCVMMEYSTKNEIENKKTLFKRQIKEKNRKPFVVPVSVAVGCAIYDENIDTSLNDTLKRADEEMYKNKQLLKSAKS